jgi:acid phosphatase
MPASRRIHSQHAAGCVLAALAGIVLFGSPADAPPRVLAAQAVSVQGKASIFGFSRVLIIVLENRDYRCALREPFLDSLSSVGATFTHFTGVAHPSYNNYLAMVSGIRPLRKGEVFESELAADMSLPDRTIADLLEAHHLTWRNYAEDYPGTNGRCYLRASGRRGEHYVRRHVPFISFTRARHDNCANIVPAEQFQRDLDAGALPTYMFYSPNLIHDAHNSPLPTATAWLRSFLVPLLKNDDFMRETLVVVTFDESAGDRSYCEGELRTASTRKLLNHCETQATLAARERITNRVYTVFLGSMVQPGTCVGTPYNHYNVLRTIEESFQIGTLHRNDDTARIIGEPWVIAP